MAKKKGKREEDDKGRSGGINIGGNVGNVGGDIVGGDKKETVHGDKITMGNVGAGAAVAAGRGASASIQSGVSGGLMKELLSFVKQEAPPAVQAEAEQQVAALEEQVKAKEPDLGIVGKSLKWLKKNVPGVQGALDTVLSQPLIGQGIKDIAAVILDDD
jgi:hypothetical protein